MRQIGARPSRSLLLRGDVSELRGGARLSNQRTLLCEANISGNATSIETARNAAVSNNCKLLSARIERP